MVKKDGQSHNRQSITGAAVTISNIGHSMRIIVQISWQNKQQPGNPINRILVTLAIV